MRWNGLPWSEERWHCYSGTDRRWRSTHGYGWQMTENSLRWFFRHDDAAGKWRVEFTLHKKIVGRTTRQMTPTGATRFVYLQAASSGPGLVQTLVNLKESYTSVTFFYSYCMIPGWKSSKACSPADNVMKWQSLQLWKAPWLRKRWEPAVGSWAGSSLQKHDSYYRNPACNWVDSLIPLVMPASACIHDDSCPTWCVIG